jgi:hypothetical protein
MSEPQTDASSMRSSIILEGVPRIGFGVHMSPFPGSLYAYLAYVGNPTDYDLIMGYTGACFRRLWNRDDGGNVDLSYFGDEPFGRAFHALGYDWEEVPAQKTAMIDGIRRSLTKGRPAISFGIIGPPEAGLVTGYSEHGAVLHGWSYFQGWPEHGQPHDTYYAKPDWFETMDRNAGKGLILVGDRLPQTNPRELLVSALEWAIDLETKAHRPSLPTHVAGLCAYEAWASGLEVDEDYPADNPRMLSTRVMVHGDQCTMSYERHNAAGFLRRMTETVPDLPQDCCSHLQSAAELYDADDRMSVLWPWGDDMGEDAQQGIAQVQVRRAMAAAIRDVGAREAHAVSHLQAALAALKGT